jgi:hypothetical protein
MFTLFLLLFFHLPQRMDSVSKLKDIEDLVRLTVKTGSSEDAVWELVYPFCKEYIKEPALISKCIDLYQGLINLQMDQKLESVVLTHVGDLYRYNKQLHQAATNYLKALALQPKNGWFDTDIRETVVFDWVDLSHGEETA